MLSRDAHQRYHSLDSLRALMMALGVVIHGAVSYVTPPPMPEWAFRDFTRAVFFDLLAVFIHSFRMPVFFVIAGFFGAFLYRERGEHNFLRNRLQRVALPLALFWPLLFPLVIAGFWYAQGRTGQRTIPDLGELLAFTAVEATFLHLWFLYNLLLFYLAALLVARIPVPQSVADGHRRAFRALLQSPFRALGLGFISAITLLPMDTGALDTKSSLIPYLPGLIAYGVYFIFGWLLYQARDLLPSLQQGAWLHMGLGLLLFPLNLKLLLAVLQSQPTPDPAVRALAALTSGMVSALLVFAWLGLAMRYLHAYHRVVRYLTDASYWVYLTHLPFAIWIPGFLVGSGLPVAVKFLTVQGVTFSLTLLSYHYLVRSTAIGALLNGRRYPRALPPPLPDAASAGQAQPRSCSASQTT